MANNDTNYSREVRYKQVMNPFAEFLPDTWPSNSDDYFTLLASTMREAGVTEEIAIFRITTDNTFEDDNNHLAALIHNVYAASADAAKPTLTKAQSKVLAQREFFERRYELRYNTVIDVTEYRERKRLHTAWRPVSDKTINSMAVNAQEEGVEMWDKHPRIDKFFHRIPVDHEQWYPLATNTSTSSA